MVSLKLDSKNNLEFGDNLFIVDGIDAIRQDVKNRCLFWRGENPFNTKEGIDYLKILQASNKGLLIASIREEILKDDRIVSSDVEILDKSGKLEIQLNIKTKKGEIINV